jgi:hypothetical protein
MTAIPLGFLVLNRSVPASHGRISAEKPANKDHKIHDILPYPAFRLSVVTQGAD